jgi:hypothetical protein
MTYRWHAAYESGCYHGCLAWINTVRNYDVVSSMRFSKRDVRAISALISWRETTRLGQVRTASRCYCASKEEALSVRLTRLAMPSRVEDLERIFFRCKTAIAEIFYEGLECFLAWTGPLVTTLQADFLQSRARHY